jgi:hypothetical protein
MNQEYYLPPNLEYWAYVLADGGLVELNLCYS